MDTNGHYKVVRRNHGGGDISSLACVHCPVQVYRRPARAGDRSGLPAYNRMRGIMVRHLHEAHHDQMALGPFGEAHHFGDG